MTQLILDADGEALNLPETRQGGYTVSETPLYRDTEMASGRLARELRGLVYTVQYQYGYLDTQQRESFLRLCQRGWQEPLTCSILPPGSGGDMVQSEFFVTDMTFPQYVFSRKNLDQTETPMWGDFRLTLREVRPHA